MASTVQPLAAIKGSSRDRKFSTLIKQKISIQTTSMSFFGFDPSAHPGSRNQQQNDSEAYDFQETYDGLGEDAFNDDTFGGNVGSDFNFGGQAPPPQHHQQHRAPPQLPHGQSYAQGAATTSTDEEFMHDLWGTANAPAHAPEGLAEKKILSLEEIEAQLTAIDQPQQHQQFPGYGPGYGIPPQFGGYMMPPNFIPPPGYGYPVMQGYQGYPPQHPQGHPQGGSTPGPPGIQQQPQQQQPQQVQQVQQPQQHQQHQQHQQPQQPQQNQQHQQPQQHQHVHQPQPLVHAPQVPAGQSPVRQNVTSKADLSKFPVLGGPKDEKFDEHFETFQGEQIQPQQHQQAQPHQHHQQAQHHHKHQQNQQNNQQNQQQTPDQQQKFAKRQEKVARIMKYSGIMNPKDKDFVTRFQLSQIVTEDPYNEDFYAQVYKVIHPKNNPLQNNQHNSIAQAYLEQSGHRLGGRQMRVDIALQRMQQQVQKAVTVAKERPKLSQYTREGALGKIAFGSGKKPRQQLEIISKAAQRELEKKAAEEAGISNVETTRSTKKYTKKDIMGTLENIITELMNVESESRTSTEVDTTGLWEALKVLEQSSSLGDNDAEVNPFIQCLNYNKALKILLRLFKFLSREQILTIVALIMSNLENLSVIKNGSYTTYENKKVPDLMTKLVEAYSMSFSKVLMNATLDFKFNEIIGLLVILIEHNNVSFVSTTKIGLSILTTLISRAEVIIGEGSISATDLSEWSSCYDELFTSLESRIAGIFPPESVDDIGSTENYVWQFLATLSLGGKLSHQRIIVDEVRDEIFSVMSRAKAIDNSDVVNLYKKQNLLSNLNMYLVVMGLVADEFEIKELA